MKFLKIISLSLIILSVNTAFGNDCRTDSVRNKRVSCDDSCAESGWKGKEGARAFCTAPKISKCHDGGFWSNDYWRSCSDLLCAGYDNANFKADKADYVADRVNEFYEACWKWKCKPGYKESADSSHRCDVDPTQCTGADRYVTGNNCVICPIGSIVIGGECREPCSAGEGFSNLDYKKESCVHCPTLAYGDDTPYQKIVAGICVKCTKDEYYISNVDKFLAPVNTAGTPGGNCSKISIYPQSRIRACWEAPAEDLKNCVTCETTYTPPKGTEKVGTCPPPGGVVPDPAATCNFNPAKQWNATTNTCDDK